MCRQNKGKKHTEKKHNENPNNNKEKALKKSNKQTERQKNMQCTIPLFVLIVKLFGFKYSRPYVMVELIQTTKKTTEKKQFAIYLHLH